MYFYIFIYIYMNMYVPVFVTHAHAHTRTHAHNNFIQQGIRDTYDSLLDPYNSMRTLSCTNTPNLHIFNWTAQ